MLENHIGPMTRSQTNSLSTNNHANVNQHTMKRKSHSKNRDDQRKKTKKQNTFICGICFGSVKESKIFTNTSCNHQSFCTKCITKYVRLQRKQKVVKINCPESECSVELKPQNLISVLPNKVLVDWESAIYESEIDLDKKIYCPYKDCSVLLVNDSDCGDVVTSCECPCCHRLFCVQCKVPWHADMNCEEFQVSEKSRAENFLDEKFLKLVKRRKWQKCPKCNMYVQRNRGCPHIVCRCGCNFCYKCGEDWKHRHTCDTPQPQL